ncbi:MAG: hypothetical protein K8R60_03250 [Burkholderiales bacterium]|nr:hypothetical protein [Burkholderiales bacterium]
MLAAAPARALEPFKIYDRFGDKTIDQDRWLDGEKVRVIKGGQMQLMQRSYGQTISDFGVTPTNWHTNVSIPGWVTSLKARITVSALETTSCPTNTTPGDARARILASLFNAYIPLTGSQLNDVLAQVRLYRASSSTDPAGLLQVQGILYICTSTDCNSATTIGNVVDLGTVMVGTPTTVSLQWDRPGKTVYFSREGGPTGTVAYAESDVQAPSFLFKQLSTRVVAPNCMSAPRVSGMVDALFDNVSVNQSAAAIP